MSQPPRQSLRDTWTVPPCGGTDLIAFSTVLCWTWPKEKLRDPDVAPVLFLLLLLLLPLLLLHLLLFLPLHLLLLPLFSLYHPFNFNTEMHCFSFLNLPFETETVKYPSEDSFWCFTMKKFIRRSSWSAEHAHYFFRGETHMRQLYCCFMNDLWRKGHSENTNMILLR